MKALIAATVLLFTLSSLPVNASFILKNIPLQHPANGDLLKFDRYLAVSGHATTERWLTLINLDDFAPAAVTLPNKAQFFTRMTDGQGDALVVLTSHDVRRYQPTSGEFVPLFDTTSLYALTDTTRMRQLNFVHQVDGHSVFVIPDFHKVQVFFPTDKGYQHSSLDLPAVVQTFGDTPRFFPRAAWPADFNQDGRTDLIFLRDGQLQIFLQQSDGKFSETATHFKPPMPLSLDQETRIRGGEGRDFAGLEINHLHDIADLDGDGLPDIIIRREEFHDAIEVHTSYRIHYASRDNGHLQYSANADTVINTRGMQFEPVFADINGDGRKDFYTPGAQFGVGSVIRALLSGNTGIEMQFYIMDEKRGFNSKPDHTHKATAQVSVRRASLDMPLFGAGSLDGDPHKHLVIGEGRDRLHVIPAGKRRLFETQGTRYAVALPNDGSRVRIMDINNDGLDDIILPFDNNDSEETRNRLHILIMQPAS